MVPALQYGFCRIDEGAQFRVIARAFREIEEQAGFLDGGFRKQLDKPAIGQFSLDPGLEDIDDA